MRNKWFIYIVCLLLGFVSNVSFAQPIHLEFHGSTEELLVQYRYLGREYEHHTTNFALDIASAEYIRYLYVDVIQPTSNRTLYSGIFHLPDQNHRLDFALDSHQEYARTISTRSTIPEYIERESLEILISGLLVAIILLFVHFVHHRFRNSSLVPQEKRPRNPPSVWNILSHMLPIIWWIAITIIWFYPLLHMTQGQLLGNNHDSFGTLWFIDAASRWQEGFTDASTDFPIGARYGRLDSFILYLLSLWGFDTGFSTIAIFHGVLFVGFCATGWSCQMVAEKFGATRPYSVLAGLLYVGSGLAHMTIVEGHIYHLLQPWLVWMVYFVWKWLESIKNMETVCVTPSAMGTNSVSEQNTPKNPMTYSMLVVLCFAFTVYSSAYLGLNALILIVSAVLVSLPYLLPTLQKSTWFGGQWWIMWLGCLVVGLSYVNLFASFPSDNLVLTDKTLGFSSTTLSNMFYVSSEIHEKAHSIGLGWSALAVVVFLSFQHILSMSTTQKRYIQYTCLLSLLCSMGPTIHLTPQVPILPSPLFWMRNIPFLDMLDFPIRLAWVATLMISIVTALIASVIATKTPSTAKFIGVAITLELLLRCNVLNTLEIQNTATPSVLQQTHGSIHNLFPIYFHDHDANLHFTSISCLFQTQHHQPITDDCISVAPQHHQRIQLSETIFPALLTGDITTVYTTLEKAHIDYLAVYPDTFPAQDWLRIHSQLLQMDTHPTHSTDNGLACWVFAVQPPQPTPTSTTQTTIISVDFLIATRPHIEDIYLEHKGQLLPANSLFSLQTSDFARNFVWNYHWNLEESVDASTLYIPATNTRLPIVITNESPISLVYRDSGTGTPKTTPHSSTPYLQTPIQNPYESVLWIWNCILLTGCLVYVTRPPNQHP